MDESENGRDNDTLVYSMRDFNQQTAHIMNEIARTGKSAYITKHGRFIAIVKPLTPGQIESRVLTKMAREISHEEEHS